MTPADHANTVRGYVSDYQDVISAPDVDRMLAALDALVAQAERPHALVLSDLYDERDAAEAERDRMKEERDNWHASNFGERQARQAAEAERDELRARLTEWETSVATEALKAEREAAVQAAEHAREALRQAEPALDELIAWINTDMSGCLEVEARGEAARLAVRAALTEDEGCEYHRPLFVKGCRDCAALTEDTP